MKKLVEKLKKEYDDFLKNVDIDTSNMKKLKNVMEEAAVKISIIEALEKFKMIPTKLEDEIYKKNGILDICYKIWKMRNIDRLDYEYTTIFSIALSYFLGDVEELNDETIFISNTFLNSEKIMNRIMEELYEVEEDIFENEGEETEEKIIKSLIIGILNLKEAGLPDDESEDKLLETENLLQEYYNEFSKGEIKRIVEMISRKILNTQIKITQELILDDENE